MLVRKRGKKILEKRKKAKKNFSLLKKGKIACKKVTKKKKKKQRKKKKKMSRLYKGALNLDRRNQKSFFLKKGKGRKKRRFFGFRSEKKINKIQNIKISNQNRNRN